MKSRISDETRERKGRGTGDLEKYVPWLKGVDIGPMISRHYRPPGQLIDRHFELLSGHEYNLFCIVDFATNIYDIKEQFPLPLEATLRIAESQGLEHIRDEEWNTRRVSTDFLLILKNGKKIAVSVKESSELVDPRVIEKLEIERAYWESIGIEWVLITEIELETKRKLLENVKTFRERYFLKLGHVESVVAVLKNIDWNSNTTVAEILRQCSRTCKITFGQARKIFTQLLAHKKIKFDYDNLFTIDLPIYQFEVIDL